MKKLRIPLYIGALLCVLTTLCMCSSDESKLEKKWQLRQVRTTDGAVEAVDSVYFSFMDGTFMLNCINPDGGYDNLNGSYSFSGDQIIMTLTEGDAQKLKALISDGRQGVWHYLYWAESAETFDASKEFQVARLSGSALHLVSGQYTSIFHKF